MGQAHTRAARAGKTLLVQDMTSWVLAPVNVGINFALTSGARAVRYFRPRGAILRENAELRRQVRDLNRENASLREAARQNVALRRALGLRGSMAFKSIAAEVIAREESTWFDTATINRGRSSGVAKGDAAVNHLGIVGQVVAVDEFTSEVVALSDQNSAVGAMVQSSRSSGILRGQGTDYPVLTYLPKDARVKERDLVVSSGMGQVVPKGFVIGRVVKVVRNPIAGTTSAVVRPSVHFDEVEQVFVVKSPR